jgi:hypothetical protein
VEQEPNTVESFEERGRSRSGFLRQMAKTLAVGLGVALVPASRAMAAGGSCCRNSECGSCSPGVGPAYKCFDNCRSGGCCVGCLTGHDTCFNFTGCFC